MQTLEQAQETNRRLNRRLQQLEGPYQSRLDRLREEVSWHRTSSLRERQENDELKTSLFTHWLWHVACAFVIAALVFYR